MFKSPSLLYLNLKINEGYNFENFDFYEKINPKIDLKKLETTDESINEKTVILEIKIDDEDCPFILEIKIGTVFEWNDNIKDNKIEDFLNVNAPALLLSYSRPIIANITQQSGLPPYNIPFMNFNNDNT